MTNSQTPPNGHDNFGPGSPLRGRPARSGYLNRRSGEDCWHVVIRTAAASGRISTGTADEGEARAIAATILADANAGRFALNIAPTEARTQALLEGIKLRAARREQRRGTSETKAGNGQSEIRKPGP